MLPSLVFSQGCGVLGRAIPAVSPLSEAEVWRRKIRGPGWGLGSGVGTLAPTHTHTHAHAWVFLLSHIMHKAPADPPRGVHRLA